jgi:HD-GYP domain-containing protein (c-di-GMP phosphodiesterase class II)
MIQLAAAPVDTTCGYIPVSTSTLVPEKSVGVALHIREAPDRPPILYRGADYPITNEDIERLASGGVKNLWVASGDHERYQQYLRNNLAEVVHNSSIPLPRRLANLNEVVRDVLEEVFSRGNVNRLVEQTNELAYHTVDLITQHDDVASTLFQMLYHDYHTFTHSANVSYYCVLLAKGIGIDEREDLQKIAAGALLHDLGKLDVPSAILVKPGRLTDEDFAIIKQHPTTGFTQLARRSDVTFGQLMMVYQHHERMDGSGYPVGVTADEIHPWAQICAVADVYEALTSHRPYRRALATCEALQIMDREAGPRLNRELLECWKAIIPSD